MLIKLWLLIGVIILAIWAAALGLTTMGDQDFKNDQFVKAREKYNLAHQIFPFLIDYPKRALATDLNVIDRNNPEEESGLEDKSMAFNPENNVLGVTAMVPVLMYHYIRVNPVASDRVGFNLSVTPENFLAQMDYLASHGYTTISLDDLGGILLSKGNLPKKPIVITFDDGYADCYTAAFPVLKSHNFKALNFIITGVVGAPNYLTWDEINEMKNSGVFSFGGHTVHHYALTYLSTKQARSEINESRKTLQEHLGAAPNWFAYPYGNVDSRIANLVKEAGFAGAFGTNNGTYQSTDYLFTLPRIRVSGGDKVSSFAAKLPWR